MIFLSFDSKLVKSYTNEENVSMNEFNPLVLSKLCFI